MRRGVASLRDDSPSASAKGAKSAKGDRLVVQVEVVGLDDGVVALVLPGGVSVGGEITVLMLHVPSTVPGYRYCSIR